MSPIGGKSVEGALVSVVFASVFVSVVLVTATGSVSPIGGKSVVTFFPIGGKSVEAVLVSVLVVFFSVFVSVVFVVSIGGKSVFTSGAV